jgi:uncharacterized protein YndB with AHSA1/START domain
MRVLLFGLAALLAAPAPAAVVSASPNGFHVRQTAQLVAAQPAAFSSFSRIGSWWNKEHTYSGDAANLSLALTPGGCFCERLPEGGGIEHMRVTFVKPGERIVLTGALGPLLFEATTGVMDVQFERIAGGTRVSLDYRAAGFAEGGAEKFAPVVDAVLAEQMKRFREFARTQPAR